MMINEQLDFFGALTHTQREQENTERIVRPDEKIMCLFNGEYGEHMLDELNMSRKQMGKTLALQESCYTNYVGIEFGDFVCQKVEYDWGKHTQVWTVRCKLCGEISQHDNGYQWSRGKTSSVLCHCRKERKMEEANHKRIESEQKKEERARHVREEIGKVYGKYEVIEYKGYDSCVVVCKECGARRVKGVSISKLQHGIYPVCNCGRAKYSEWVGRKCGHLTVAEYIVGKFRCVCDCGRERIVSATYFAYGRYYDCGDPKCEYMHEHRAKAINAQIRGKTYEYVAEAIVVSNGYKVKHVGKTGDYGVDLIATAPDGKKIAIQCKSNMKSPTNLGAIQQVYAGGRYYGLEHFAVISHSGYSAQAVKMAKRLGIYLSDGSEFIYPADIKKYANELIPTLPVCKNEKAQRLYEMNGEQKTLANWAFEYGVTVEKIRKGLKRDLTLKNAIEFAKKCGKWKRYTVNGISGTIGELCYHFGIVTEACANYRISRGMSVEDAVLMPKQKGGRPMKKKETCSDSAVEGQIRMAI